MSRKKKDPQPVGRRHKWSPAQLEFLMSHVGAYLDAERKSGFWHELFPLWFAAFPTPDGVPPSSLWSSNNNIPTSSGDNDKEDSAMEPSSRKGKKKTMTQMSPDEAVIQVRVPLLSDVHKAEL